MNIPSIPDLIDWLFKEFGSNDFLIGILVPGLLAYVAYTGRHIFGLMINYIKMMTTSEITFNTDNNFYDELAEYLYNKTVSKLFQRFFILSYSWNSSDLQLTVGYGRSLGFIGIFPIMINRVVEESQSARFKERITITVFGGRRQVINRLLDNMRDVIKIEKESNSIRIYNMSGGDITLTAKKPKRSMDTILIPQKDKDYITHKLEEFMESEQDYIRKGVPYHMGVILYGKPGTGKTSLIHALASRYNKDIYFYQGGPLDLSEVDLSNSFLVIEDIDVNGLNVSARESGSSNNEKTDDLSKYIGVNMSTVLNFLDGLTSPHGLITFATTNHYDQLDSAIIRPGRFDVHKEFGDMKWPEWCGLCTLLERNNPITEDMFKEISPAKARYMLMYYNDVDIINQFKDNGGS